MLIIFISVEVLNIGFSVPWFDKWYYHFVTAFAVYVTINAATVFAQLQIIPHPFAPAYEPDNLPKAYVTRE